MFCDLGDLAEQIHVWTIRYVRICSNYRPALDAKTTTYKIFQTKLKIWMSTISFHFRAVHTSCTHSKRTRCTKLTPPCKNSVATVHRCNDTPPQSFCVFLRVAYVYIDQNPDRQSMPCNVSMITHENFATCEANELLNRPNLWLEANSFLVYSVLIRVVTPDWPHYGMIALEVAVSGRSTKWACHTPIDRQCSRWQNRCMIASYVKMVFLRNETNVDIRHIHI
jgi:hypothetical protein